MNYWSVKQIADMLGITIQAIYKNKDEYIQKGYMEKDQDGKYVFNLNGYNYLINKRKGVKPVIEHIEPGAENIQKEYIDTLKKRVEQLEQELLDQKKFYINEIEQERTRTAYFKELFEQKDRQITTYLLPGADNEPKKKSWFNWFKN